MWCPPFNHSNKPIPTRCAINSILSILSYPFEMICQVFLSGHYFLFLRQLHFKLPPIKILLNLLLRSMIPLCYTTPTSNFGHDIFIIFNALRNPQPGFHFWISFAFFSKEFTQIFDEVTRSPQLSVIPGTDIATVSSDKWYGTSEFTLFLHCLFILKMLKYIQKVSMSDSSREETYGNKQHDNFKWGTQCSLKRQRC